MFVTFLTWFWVMSQILKLLELLFGLLYFLL